MNTTVHIICGPTAGGKSARGLAIAQEKNGVIINADSLQIYNRLPILTAQPSAEDLALVPHRLYGFLAPDTQMTAGAWRKLALNEIRIALDNNQTPILVGGTGFYIKALIEGLSPIPEIPNSVRIETEKLMDEMGPEEFHKALSQKDPEIAARLHPNDRQRTMRAWEVFTHTGEKLSELQKLPKIPPDENLKFEIELVLPEREILRQRCDDRFRQMIQIGALDEVSDLDKEIQSGKLAPDAPITHALGFSSLQDYLHGKTDLETAIDLSQTETRQYAKRQTTWFKNQLP